MTRLEFVLAVLLAAAGVMGPAPVSAEDDAAGVTGAGEGIFPSDASFNGVMLSSLQLGQGLFISQDGTAAGHFHAVLRGTSFLGLAQEIVVDGKVTGGSAGDGSATFSGSATVDMGDGTLPLMDVPFWVTVSTGGLTLTLYTTPLPTATITAGSITIE